MDKHAADMRIARRESLVDIGGEWFIIRRPRWLPLTVNMH